MENNNIKRNVILLFLFLLLATGKLVSREVILEQTIPPGWLFKEFYHQGGSFGLKALFLIQDVPPEVRASGKVSRRLEIFDSQNKLVADLILPEGHWFEGFISNDRLLISVGDEGGAGRVKVLDFNGREIYSLDAGGRLVQKGIIGSEFALTPRLGIETGPISIIDGEKGIEKLRIAPYPKGPQGQILPGSFLVIGDGYYVTALGATLFLENYNQPGKKLWIIKNIGGNIRQLMVLNEDLIAVGYENEADFKHDEFESGLAVINWRTGKILFRKSARPRDANRNFWYPAIKYLNLVLEEDGSLLFYRDDEAVRLPEVKAGGQLWDEGKAIKLRSDPSQTNYPVKGKKEIRVEKRKKYVIICADNLVRVERRRWISE